MDGHSARYLESVSSGAGKRDDDALPSGKKMREKGGEHKEQPCLHRLSPPRVMFVPVGKATGTLNVPFESRLPASPGWVAGGGIMAHGRYPITQLLGSIVTTNVRL